MLFAHLMYPELARLEKVDEFPLIFRVFVALRILLLALTLLLGLARHHTINVFNSRNLILDILSLLMLVNPAVLVFFV